MENEKIKGEKRILKISVAGTVVFVLAEIACAVITGSMALLIDCVYDGTDMLMAIPFIILIPKLYKPLTERRPYGYSQVESFFLLIKYSALLFLTLMLIKESIEAILTGGNPVESGFIAVFELCVSAGCLVMMLMFNFLAKGNMTPTLKAEQFLWKLSCLSTLGVGIAFIVSMFLSHGDLAWICPYIDPAVAVICAVFLLKEPVQMIVESVKNLILFAPKVETTDRIEEIAREKCEKYGFRETFCEVIKTGRKYWINVYYCPDGKTVDLDCLNELDMELEGALEEEFDDVWLEMIMDLLDYRGADESLEI